MGIGIVSKYWKVDGKPIYEPSIDTQIDHESIQSSDSGRVESGEMHIEWIRRNMVKIMLKWGALTGNEVENLESLVHGKEFNLTYYDKGRTMTARVYVSKLTYKKYSDVLYEREGGLYRDISCNAVEV